MTTDGALDKAQTLDWLLGTVAEAMHTEVLLLDPDMPQTSPPAGWSGLASPAHRWSAMAERSGW